MSEPTPAFDRNAVIAEMLERAPFVAGFNEEPFDPKTGDLSLEKARHYFVTASGELTTGPAGGPADKYPNARKLDDLPDEEIAILYEALEDDPASWHAEAAPMMRDPQLAARVVAEIERRYEDFVKDIPRHISVTIGPR